MSANRRESKNQERKKSDENFRRKRRNSGLVIPSTEVHEGELGSARHRLSIDAVAELALRDVRADKGFRYRSAYLGGVRNTTTFRFRSSYSALYDGTSHWSRNG